MEHNEQTHKPITDRHISPGGGNQWACSKTCPGNHQYNIHIRISHGVGWKSRKEIVRLFQFVFSFSTIATDTSQIESSRPSYGDN